MLNNWNWSKKVGNVWLKGGELFAGLIQELWLTVGLRCCPGPMPDHDFSRLYLNHIDPVVGQIDVVAGKSINVRAG